MRRLALAAWTLAAAFVVAGLAAPAIATSHQDGPDPSFTVACHQVRCVFDASNSTLPGEEIAEHRWSFGDGNTGTGEVRNHIYAAPGTYNVTLEIEGENGTTAETTREIRVLADRPEDPDQPPWSALGVGVAVFGGTVLLVRKF